MSVLMNVAKPLQSTDSSFMTEWVAIFRPRDNVTIANLQEARLKLVVLARARARELQVDMQVEHAQQPLSAKTATPTTKSKSKPVSSNDKPVCRFFLKPNGSKNGDNCQYAHPRTHGKRLRCGSEAYNLQARTRPRRQQSSRTSNTKPGPKKDYSKPKGKTAEAQSSKAPVSTDQKKGKGRSKGKDKRYKPSAKSGDVDFDETAPDQEEPDSQVDGQDEQEDAEVNFADAQTSESDVDILASCQIGQLVCTNYKDGAFATVARASPQEPDEPLSDTWEWRGACCLGRVHRQLRRCLYTPTWKGSVWQDLTVQPQRISHVKPQDQSSRNPVIENVRSMDCLRSNAHPWTGESAKLHGQAPFVSRKLRLEPTHDNGQAQAYASQAV